MPPELNGILVIDKPEGVSSAGVVGRVKKIFKASKVGHAGTLDPLATGVLICCLNRATRLSRFLLKGDKTYEADLVLGTATDTQDADGTIVEQQPLRNITEERIRVVTDGFVGTITQVPAGLLGLETQGDATIQAGPPWKSCGKTSPAGADQSSGNPCHQPAAGTVRGFLLIRHLYPHSLCRYWQ